MQAVVPSAVSAAEPAAIIMRRINSRMLLFLIVVGIWMMYYVSNKQRGRAWADGFHGRDLAML